ncbi:MAG: phosphate/phosphite/phosphonate ABC transporter substrate-binding protein [Candidatus Sericytochromatia bacterium]
MIKKTILLSLSSVLLFSCNQTEDKKILRLGVIPFENTEEITKNIAPLVKVISEGTGLEVKPFVATDYSGVIEAFRGKKVDVAFMSAASYVIANQEANVKVILKSERNGSAFYYSAIITRKDSGINNLEDLKNKKFSFGDPLSTSGYIFPKKLLLENNIKPDTDFSNIIYSGTHDAVVLSILNKKVDAGATFSEDKEGKKGSWRKYLKPEEAEQLKIVGISDPIPSDNICVSESLDTKTVEDLSNSLINFSKTNEGKELMRKIYKFDGYIKATDSDYEPIRKAFKIAGVELKDTIKKK